MNVCWFSCGVSSAITAWLARKELNAVIYQHVDDQHPDSLRFLADVEKMIGRNIIVQRSPYRTVENVCRTFGFWVGVHGARCTDILKKRMRKEWECDNPGRHTYFWGIDCTEKKRADRIVEIMPEHDHRFPLIENSLTKEDAHALLRKLGVKRPVMYDLGYRNNNCIGCLKGGAGYWNKIRVDFPDVFKARAKLERDLGRFILHDKNGPMWLDELDPERGRNEEPVCEECGVMCELGFNKGETK